MSQIKDSILGFIVGDAFGVPYEGYQRKNLNKEKYPEDFLANSVKIFIWWLKPTQNLETFIVSFSIFS